MLCGDSLSLWAQAQGSVCPHHKKSSGHQHVGPRDRNPLRNDPGAPSKHTLSLPTFGWKHGPPKKHANMARSQTLAIYSAGLSLRCACVPAASIIIVVVSVMQTVGY